MIFIITEIKHKHVALIHSEIVRVLSKSYHLKGYENIEVNSVRILPSNKEEIISVSLLFTRNLKLKHTTPSNINGHCGLQIYIPRKIVSHRDNILSDILK